MRFVISYRLAIVLALAIPGAAYAQEDPHFIGPLPQQIAPEWSEGSEFSYYSGEERPNQQIEDLATKRTLSLIPKELQVTPIDDRQANGLKQSYYDMMRPYEEKEKWSTLTLLERTQRDDAMRGFVNGLRNQIQTQQFLQRRDALVKLLPRKQLGNAVNAIPKPVQIVAAVAGSFLSGQSMDWHLVPETRIRTQVDLLNQRTQLSFYTSVVDTSVSLRGQTQGNIDPNGPPPGEFPAKSYRYEISVSKSAPELALSAGLTYISSTESMRASVSKLIAPNLVAEVGTSQPLNPNNRVQPREESVRVQYGMNF